MGLFSKKTSCLGLDIGEHGMKMLEIRSAGGGYEVAGFAVAPAPHGLMEGSTIIDEQRVVSTLQSLRDKIHLQSQKAALVVPGDNVIVRNLILPVMPDEELSEAVRFEAEAQLPIPGKDVTIDFIKGNSITDGGVKKQEVMAVAVRNEIIKRLVRIAEAVGLEPVVMDIEPLALQRAVKILNPAIIPHAGNYAIVNIGSSSTGISVFEKDMLTFTRTLGYGGNKLTMSLANHYKIPIEEAEGTKKLIDLSGESDRHGLSVLLCQKAEILLPLIGELVTEIGRSLEFYLAQHRGQSFARIFITGGGAQLKGMASYMNDRLDLPVSVFDPTEYLKLSGKVRYLEKEIQEAGSALSQVVGLALSEVD